MERWRCPPCSQARRKKRARKVAIVEGAPRIGIPDPVVILDDDDLTLFNGDCLDVLSELPDESVHMCATSPPFYGLRDYGMDGQIGLEETPEEWVERLVDVFREVRRVLRHDGTLWVEIGDSYNANYRTGQDPPNSQIQKGNQGTAAFDSGIPHKARKLENFKRKDLLGQPWMLAFALRADGWYLRSEIIWARPNPMPESVSDRPTKAHSTVFLLSKSPSYFYDADAIREAFSENTHSKGKGVGVKQEAVAESGTLAAGRNNSSFNNAIQHSHVDHQRFYPQVETLDGSDGEAPRGPDGRRQTGVQGRENSEQHRDGERWPNPGGANARSVWTIATEPTPFAHFATWPTKLVAKMILAGTSEAGCCPECGAPWNRDVEKGELVGENRGGNYRGREDDADASGANRFASKNEYKPGMSYERTTTGWSPACEHNQAPVPATVLDPFAGSGTTLFVARSLGRHSIGIELNQKYCDLVAARTQQLSLLT